MIPQILSLGKARVLVLGDIMLDRYISGTVQRMSPEAPVPVVTPSARWSVPGGAANVAMNVCSLGAKVGLVCALSNDDASREISRGLDLENMQVYGLEAGRPIPVKTRIRTDLQHIVRIDDEQLQPLNLDHEILNLVETLLESDEYNLLLISDYAKGLLNEDLFKKLIQLGRNLAVPVITDPKSARPETYEGIFLLKPNLVEAQMLIGGEYSVSDSQDLDTLARKVLEVTKAENVVVTAASLGCVLVNSEESYYYPAQRNVEVRDVSGAGDTFISYIAAGISNGNSVPSSCELATLAATLSCTKIGTTPITPSDLIIAIGSEITNTSAKFVPHHQLHEVVSLLPRPIVFTNGCFDVIHPGHIESLEFARAQGASLIVACNSDQSVKQLKGEHRPLQTFESRIRILSALTSTTIICQLDDLTPINLIEIVKPDVLVKGSDYLNQEVVGQKYVEEYGGKVVLSPILQGHSTSGFEASLLNRPRN
jgi:D-beta-D-heptose 7-phosphate kinase/D-beta-D-heptose 1-phosphate adenosyltransferase